MFLVPTPEIYHYIAFRAKKEGQSFELGEYFFKYRVAGGIREFFGARIDETGDVLSDRKHPTWFEEFKNQ